ncbi:MAG: RluA family pseudouridine synthase [Candidatus Acidiferrales bacterium]
MHDYSDIDENRKSAESESASALSRSSEFVVRGEQAGQRLDRFLAAQFPDISRTQVQTLIDQGRVLVGGIAKKPSHHVELGEQIAVEIAPPPVPGVEAENIPLAFLYEDADIAIVNKPAGMIVHPGAGADAGTLVAALLHHFGVAKGLSSVGGPLRPGIVHRLDKGTSGAIVIARNDLAHLKLIKEFRERRVQKTYVALLHGAVKGAKGTIELPVARDLRRRSRMTSRRAEGREARTDWRLRLRLGNFSLIEADLHTGRTHQIRVHFSALGFPVVGDTLYGAPHQERIGRAMLPSLGRNFLHAARIAFAHPRTGQQMEFRAPLPNELVLYIHELGGLIEQQPNEMEKSRGGVKENAGAATADGVSRTVIDAALKDYL